MKLVPKRSFSTSKVRRFLEPGPIVLVSSIYKGQTNIMTMGWHMMMGYSLIGCYIWKANHSHSLIRKSKECVINVPSVALASKIVQIGNCSGRDVEKFEKFGLTKENGKEVSAPLIADCHANIECRLVDERFIKDYELFVFKVVAARAATSPRLPKTIHYRGDGKFIVSGSETRRWRKLFQSEMLNEP